MEIIQYSVCYTDVQFFVEHVFVSILITVKSTICLCVLLLNLLNATTLAADIVRMNTTNQANDLRTNYKIAVLTQAMESTLDSYGPYEIQIVALQTTAKRALIEVQSGRIINLFMGVTTPEWEQKNLPIRIPIRRGILSYRVLAVHKEHLASFAKVKKIDDLKKLAAGLRVGWATTDTLKQQRFSYYELESLDGLYHMLNRQAIDYIPRGINEVYDEISVRQPNHLQVEPTLLLYLPAPTYIIVSPNETILAKRIEAGLEIMIKKGILKNLFYEFYADDLKKAEIKNRTIISIPNPNLPDHIPFDRPELWFNHDQEQVN